MKRFLATLSVMAMIVSMFSGVVLAASGDVLVKVEVDNDMVTYVDGFSPTYVSGRIVDSSTGGVRAVDTTLLVVRDGDGDGVYDSDDGDFDVTADFQGTSVTDGMFTLSFLTEIGVGTYFVIGEDVTGFEFDDYATFTVTNAIELVEPTTLEWTWGDIPDSVIVMGMFPNEDFDYEAYDLFLAYKSDPEDLRIATASYVDGGQFGFLFSGANFDRTGELALYVDTNQYDGGDTFDTEANFHHSYVALIDGEVVPAEMAVTVDPMEAMVNLGDVEFTATFDFNSAYVTDEDSEGENNLETGYTLLLTVENEDGTKIYNQEDITGLFGDEEANKVIASLDLDDPLAVPGTYEFTFELKYFGGHIPGPDVNCVIEEGTVELEAVEPDEYNLMNWDDSALKVGENLFGFSSNPCPGVRSVYVKDEDGNGVWNIEVIINGAGLEDFTFTTVDCDTDGGPFAVDPAETGMVEVTINVHEDNNLDNILHTFTRELAVEGWNVTVTPDVVDVDSEVDITITITDEDGNPVNNAIITSPQGEGDGKLFDGTTTNVVGGVYVLEYDDDNLKFDATKIAGDIDLMFWTEGNYEMSISADTPEVTLTDAIDVVGLEVYTVTSDTAVLLEGFTEEIVVTPLDADGDVIYPTVTVTYYDADGDEITYDHDDNTSTAEIAAHPFPGTRVDTNDDGIKESMEDDVTPVAGAVKAVVRAESSDLSEYGEVELEVVKPQVVMTGATVFTAYINTEFEFTVVDPRDGSLIEDAVYYVDYQNYLDDVDIIDEDDPYFTEDDGVYSGVLVTDDPVDFAGAEDEEEDVLLEIRMDAEVEGGIMLLEVLTLEPSFTSDPAELIIGQAANLVLTYTDAEGMPLEGYYVKLDGEELGDTDENGQIAYATIAGNTGTLEFFAEIDDDESDDIELDVPVVIDMEAPTATLVEANGMATITITDNVRVQKAMVNGVLVDMFFAAPTVVHMMPQTDLYHVQAIDQNFNYLMVTLEGARVNMLTVVIGEDCGGFGPAELVNEKTMVPVRYAEELGAVVNWNAPTASVTYTLNDGAIVITVQVGNTTAMVNGVAMEMAVAPYVNAENRVMVPIRMIAQELGFSVDYVGNGTTYIY